MEEDSEVRVCPYLGLASDASTWLSTATGSHRCHRWSTPQRIEEERQTAYCLGDSHRRCPWYVSPQGDFSSRGQAQSPAMRQRLMAVTALLGVLLVSFAVIRMLIWPAVFGGSSTTPDGGTPTPAAISAGSTGASLPVNAPAVSTPTAAATVVSSPTAGPTTGATSPTGVAATQPPAATAGPSPTRGSATTAATPARPTGTPATATPTPTLPPGAKLHEVKSGDNLYDMAKTYGVTIEEIMAANGLTDRALLKVGQKLIIPAKRQ